MVQTTTRHEARETWSGRLSRGSQVRVLPGVSEKRAAPGITTMPVLLYRLFNTQSPKTPSTSLRYLMRFIIHGAGSIGSLIGGRLAESGAEAVLVARHAHAAAVNRCGLLIKSRAGDRVVKTLSAVTHPREITPSIGDVVILTVKSSQTAASIQALRETFPEETPVVCMQNGVRNEEVAAGRFLRVYGGMLGISATFLAPGVVAHTRGELLSIGNYPLGRDDTVAQI